MVKKTGFECLKDAEEAIRACNDLLTQARFAEDGIRPVIMARASAYANKSQRILAGLAEKYAQASTPNVVIIPKEELREIIFQFLLTHKVRIIVIGLEKPLPEVVQKWVDILGVTINPVVMDD